MDSNNIFGRRLNQARLINGFTMEELAQSVNPAVSRQAINKYEKGQSMPDSRMLISLSMALGVKPDYFFRPFMVEVDKVMFRKKSKFSEKRALAVKERVREELERYLEAEQLSGAESDFKLDKIYVSAAADAAKSANDIRNSLR
ncbi:MAG: helix-turn-helix domain-containing protein, partial [Muribaculaceae bacterium]|nr:helix-turn-helix domain-containing protein [Muribaculaceae bacterium]